MYTSKLLKHNVVKHILYEVLCPTPVYDVIISILSTPVMVSKNTALYNVLNSPPCQVVKYLAYYTPTPENGSKDKSSFGFGDNL